MSHAYEHGHERPSSQLTSRAHVDSLGKTSRSALLHRPEHPVTSGLVQCREASENGTRDAESVRAPDPMRNDGAVQRPAAAECVDRALRTAQQGLAGSPRALPHLGAIQVSFGRHDVSGVQSHVGGPAAVASDALGAEAYASGNAVAFRQEPDLFTAAHEAAHVVQQRRGVQLRGGLGEAGDSYEQHADAVAAAVVQGRSAEALLDAFAAGGASSSTVQRWQAGTPKTNSEGKILRWPMKTEVGIEDPPNIILSQYANTYTPRIRFNIKNALVTVDRGDFYVDFKGAVPKRTHVPNNEGTWQTPTDANVTKDMLADPGKGNAFSSATIFAEYVAKSIDSGVDCESPAVHIQSYHDAFKGTGPEKSKTAAQLDVDNKIVITNISNNVAASAIHESWSQQTAVTTSANSSVTYGQTLSTTSTTGVTLGAKGAAGGGGQPGGEVSLGFSQQWSTSEIQSYTSAVGSGWAEANTNTRTFTVDIALPEGFKGSAVLYPFTQKRLDWVESRQHDGRGHILGSDVRDQKRWIGFNVPAGSAFVLGVDPNYIAAFKKKYGECETQYHDVQAIDRQYNAATGAAKEALAKQLNAAKAKLVTMTNELVSLQANAADSMADADAQIKKLARPSGGNVMSSDVNAIIVQMAMIKAWLAYAATPTTGR